MTVDRSAVGRKSCRKGKRRERIFARALSNFWTSGRDPNAFRRTPMSGAFGGRGSDGDILAMTPEAEQLKLVIEIKDRKETDIFEFADILTNEKCSILKWWKTLNETIQNNPQKHAGKRRLLVVHKRGKDYCIVGIPELTFFEDRVGRFPIMKIWTPFSETLVVFPLDSFFDMDPEALKQTL